MLNLERGFYGSRSKLLQARVSKQVALGEGLPGQVAQTKAPLLLTLDTPEFAGLDAVIGIPFMPAGEVEAVVLLFFNAAGRKLAAEFWAASALGTLSPVQSLYLNLEDFASKSAGSSFAVLEGLPSQVFDYKATVLLDTLSAEAGFVRVEAAAQAGLSAALGLPILDGDKVTGSLLLFAAESPLFGVQEHWRVQRGGLQLVAGVYIDEAFRPAGGLKAGEDLVGQAFTQKRPILLTSLAPGSGFGRAQAATAAGLKTALALPIVRNGKVTDVVMVLA